MKLLISRSIVGSWHLKGATPRLSLNWHTHGVSFELATTIFRAPFAIEFLDDRQDYGEERFASIGMADGEVLLFVALYRTRRPHWHHFSPEGIET